MNLSQQTRQQGKDNRTKSDGPRSRWERFLRFQASLWPVVNRRLLKHNALAMSSTLSYQTLFALIPILVLSVLVLKSFGAIDNTRESVRSLLDRVGLSQIQITEAIEVGAKVKGKPVALSEKIEEIFENVESKISVGTLGPVGVVLLIWSAVTLLATMEKTLNRVFGVNQNRSIPRRLFLYWSAMTLGPLILTSAFYISRQAMEATQNIWGISWVLAQLASWVGSLLVSILLLAAMYKFLPNTYVRYRTAMIGAMVAVPIWMLARWGFGLYVRHAANHLYGALGLIPVFLIWLNLSWLILLLGIEVAYSVTNLGRLVSSEPDENSALEATDLLATALVVARHYQSGAGPVEQEEISMHVRRPDSVMNRVLERLQTAGIVVPVKLGKNDEEVYVPGRPAGTISILEFLGINPLKKGIPSICNYDAQTDLQVRRIMEQICSHLGHLTLEGFVAPERPTIAFGTGSDLPAGLPKPAP